MKILLSTKQIDYIPDLKNGAIHIVAFAEEGLSFFKAYCEFALGFSVREGVAFCDRINRTDRTGTLWPHGKLTAMPKRFFRDEKWDGDGFQRCLRDAFIANRDKCKSRHLVFQFFCVALHRERYFSVISDMALSEFSGGILERVTVHLDELQN